MAVSFGKLRSFFFPIHKYEMKKIFPMLLLFFFFSFNFFILKDTKEPLIVTASGSGAESLPFLKMWGVFPLAVVFMLVYSKLSNHFKKQTLFYGTVIFFISFFVLFSFVLYPNREFLHPIASANHLQKILPKGFGGFVSIYRNWTFSLYYAMAELWGSVGLSILFWGFANDITRVEESKRFYSLFGLGSSIAMLFAGPTIMFFSRFQKIAKISGGDPWGISLKWFALILAFGGMMIVGIYRWMQKNVLTDRRLCDHSMELRTKKEKTKMSLKEAFRYLRKSRYMQLLLILVFGYGISNLLVEVVWKSQLKLQFPNPNDYSAFRGFYTTVTSIVTLFMLLFVGGNVMRKKGWKAAALITPIAFILSGIGFFSFIIFREHLTGFVSLIGMTPVMIAIIFGMVQNLVGKSCKSALFEPTKEMVYIQLDQESKVKGKSAIDVVGVKLGKVGGSLIIQGLIVFLGSLLASAPYIALILLVINIFWIGGVKALGKLMKKDSEEERESPKKSPRNAEVLEEAIA